MTFGFAFCDPVTWIIVSRCGPWLFFAIAFGFSLVYGFRCWTINELDWDDEREQKNTMRWDAGTFWWKAHQIWLNFLGSMVGWWAFWCLLTYYVDHRSSHASLTYIDMVLAIIAFLGITGRLPHVSRYGSKLFPLKKDE